MSETLLARRRLTIADLGGGYKKPPPELPRSNKKTRRAAEWPATNRLITDLCERYPAAFDAASPKPLGVGINHAILTEMDVNPKILAHALRYWTSGRRYLDALCNHKTRYWLVGQPCGEVTEAQRLDAGKRLLGK